MRPLDEIVHALREHKDECAADVYEQAAEVIEWYLYLTRQCDEADVRAGLGWLGQDGGIDAYCAAEVKRRAAGRAPADA